MPATEVTTYANESQRLALEDLSELTAGLVKCRKAAGLTQAEVADGAGVSRTTVQAGEADSATMQLLTAARLARATGARITVQAHAQAVPVAMLSHEGLAHIRTKHNQEYMDARREKALAQAWQKENKPQNDTVTPLLAELVPGCTQEQATAAATVVQWLGSELGFAFLSETLGKVGYEIVVKKR